MINHVLFVFVSVLLRGQDDGAETHQSALVYKMKCYKIYGSSVIIMYSFLFSGFPDVVNFLRDVGMHIHKPPLVHFSPV